MVKTWIVGRINSKEKHRLGAILSEHLNKADAVKSARNKSRGTGTIGVWRRETQRRVFLDSRY